MKEVSERLGVRINGLDHCKYFPVVFLGDLIKFEKMRE